MISLPQNYLHSLVVQPAREDTTHTKPRSGATLKGKISPGRGVATVEPHQATQTPTLEWDISPKGEVEVG